MYLISLAGDAVVRPCLTDKITCVRAAASESIVDLRVKNENMQHKALNPQPQNGMESPHGGSLTVPVLQKWLPCFTEEKQHGVICGPGLNPELVARCF